MLFNLCLKTSKQRIRRVPFDAKQRNRLDCSYRVAAFVTGVGSCLPFLCLEPFVFCTVMPLCGFVLVDTLLMFIKIVILRIIMLFILAHKSVMGLM